MRPIGYGAVQATLRRAGRANSVMGVVLPPDAPAGHMNLANDMGAGLSVDELEARLADLRDDELRDACAATGGMLGNDVTDLLAGEFERRDLEP